MKIYLFRHGETDWNRERRLQGQSDIPLNDAGRELAAKTAEALKGTVFDAVFSSPLCRAVETAEILSGGGVPIILDDRLREINFGVCEGQGFDAAKKDAAHPLYNCFHKPEAYIPPAGGENFREAMARAEEFLRERILPLEEQNPPCEEVQPCEASLRRGDVQPCEASLRRGGVLPVKDSLSSGEVQPCEDSLRRGVALPCKAKERNVLIVAHGAFNRALVNPIAGYPLEDFWHIGLSNCAATILTLEKGVFRVLEENKIFYGEAVNPRP